MATVAEEKLKHSIIYDASTSEIKDDAVQLPACLKTSQGALSRQEAAFLVWHHALNDPDKLGELLNNNIINVCMGVLDSPDSSPVDKSCCAGILAAIVQSEEHREAVIKGKSPANCGSAVLHAQLQHSSAGDLCLQYAARTLRLVAEDAAGRTAMLKQMEQRLMYCEQYNDLLKKCIDSTSVAHVCALIKALLHQRDDLKAQAIEAGMVETLLHVARTHKAPLTICHTAGCLFELVLERESWSRVVQADGLRLLVDMLGPSSHHPQARAHTLEAPGGPHVRGAAEAGAGGEAQGAASSRREGSCRGSGGGTQVFTQGRESAGTEVQENGSQRLEPLVIPSTPDGGGQQQQQQQGGVPDPDPRTLLSINSCGLKWHNTLNLATFSAAAGCLYEMCQNTQYMHQISRRLAASRLVPLLQAALEHDSDSKKKKGKKKGLSLSPEQTDALTHIVGCLKFLTLVNSNRYRAAQLGAGKLLKPVYEECGNTLLRRNAQVVLSNIAMMAENGQVLLEGKLPEEFLVPVPMRLSAEEIEQLAIEFPDNRLAENAAEVAAALAAEAAAKASKR